MKVVCPGGGGSASLTVTRVIASAYNRKMNLSSILLCDVTIKGTCVLEKAIASYQKISSYKIDSADASQF